MKRNKTQDKLQIGDPPISSLTVIASFISTPPQLIPSSTYIYILPTLSIEQLQPKQQPKMTVYHIGTLNLNLTLTLYHY